jgi:hypothetical protein
VKKKGDRKDGEIMLAVVGFPLLVGVYDFDFHAFPSLTQYTVCISLSPFDTNLPSKTIFYRHPIACVVFFPLPLTTIHHLPSYEAGRLSGSGTAEATFDTPIQANTNQGKDKASSAFEQS